ncbi:MULTISPECIES: ABC-F family ATP-binding cassette domain-containing protein [unclassified Bradyrhizobium]|uniref:ABC-F family ATP-binding cassette domain-containing protein n=1 Tax=unclassified Bradyrhizobium TaxID=2631580 RepID=UPI001BA4ACD3|nr:MULTISPECIES: ABC-F family ATP-binding cassette domain-containing protein [unclassified Bradyrhizobium]MBR1207823.1 ABC-F family ATP-binding cassette domain-containing protein [Bradyrhizobium sp. AUGA SZCCT0124]MBR1316362.1 ABC-F family ATP-binding cassette domain-containing protein [Bradyrhizobium sp. AUGA SZCCT0051]MBR1344373.1 ABC-F family ATP-binding cassette domain-containing protein [Bradyrhizobium sp. AUGA SZCCT0105]MBR1359384.1 ABC-F family ATP-binding cassette domain-containing prot
MPASITLSNLTLSAPDGRVLLSNIDLNFGPERTGLVGRNGVGKTTLLGLIAGAHAPQSGTVSVQGRVATLHQTVQLKPDEGVVDLFGARGALAALRRAEQGLASAEELADIDWTLDTRIASALERVGLSDVLDAPLATLSGGQATRARLAALTFAQPDFLLLDEPTNNLDRAGRQAVIDLLADWRHGAIIVSHDRELLETMDAIVELTSLEARRYGGNWSQYRARKAIELSAARHDLADAERRVAEIDRKARETFERQARKDGAGARKRAKGDLPRIAAGLRKDRSEDTGGENARLAERRRTQALDLATAARQRIEVLQPFSVQLPSTNLPASRMVLRIEGADAGYTAEAPILRDLTFSMSGPERVAITGPNGAGKTTLLKLVSGDLIAARGTVEVMTRFAMFDQAVSLLDANASILDNFRRINPDASENACRAALARFMFRADAALQTVSSLSGGQLLRVGLASVLGGPTPPPLLILDEPTNHLDIESMEAVEAGLRAYDGALLVVSHDEAFLEAIAITRRLDLAEWR